MDNCFSISSWYLNDKVLNHALVEQIIHMHWWTCGTDHPHALVEQLTGVTPSIIPTFSVTQSCVEGHALPRLKRECGDGRVNVVFTDAHEL